MNTNANTPFRFRALTLALATCLALSGCTAQPAAPVEPPLAGATIGGEFELMDTKRQPVRWADFDGKYRIVYFGYAYCPDICPTDVQRTIQGLEQFAADEPELAKKVQPIFISVDPERDTPEVIAEFTGAFSDDLIGLTGTPEQIAAAAKTFAVYYKKLDETAPGAYLMDHARTVILFGPEGEPIALLPADQGAEPVTAELVKWVR